MIELPRVTDHAVLRYMERIQGFDIEAVRAHIAAVCAPALITGANAIRVENHRFIINTRTGAVVTVEPIGFHPSFTRAEQLAEGAR